MDYSKMLKDYFDKHNITAGVFAMCAHLSPVTIYAFLNNKKKPGPCASRRILIATKGEVDFNVPYKARKFYTKELEVFRQRLRAPKKKKICSKSSMG